MPSDAESSDSNEIRVAKRRRRILSSSDSEEELPSRRPTSRHRRRLQSNDSDEDQPQDHGYLRDLFREHILGALVELEPALAAVRDERDDEPPLARGSEEAVLGRCGGALARVTALDLGGKKLGAEGARAVAGALGGMTAMTQLDLGGNELGSDGARALAGALGGMTAMTQLDLGGNELGSYGGARALGRGGGGRGRELGDGQEEKVTAFIDRLFTWAHRHGREQARAHAEGARGARGPRGAFRVAREPCQIELLFATEHAPRWSVRKHTRAQTPTPAHKHPRPRTNTLARAPRA
jgi:hypothetical protein